MRNYNNMFNENDTNKETNAELNELALSSVPAKEDEQKSVIIASATKNLNVREEPNKNSRILTVLDKGELVGILSVDDDWAQIQSCGSTAYVMLQFLDIKE